MLEITPDKRPLVELVAMADAGRLCLPNFQRDFVWPRDQVADLLRSVVRGYFIGSLLLLRCDPTDPPFPPVLLRGAKGPLRPDLMLLDGQQRITSLLYALTAPGGLLLKDSSKPRRFFLDLKLVDSDPYDDDIVVDRAANDLGGLESPEGQYRLRMLPFEKLLTQDSFYEWLYPLEDWLAANDPDGYLTYKSEGRSKLNKLVTRFQGFMVPLVELPRVDPDDADAVGRVCAIFEKLNSSGIELSVYDLLTARLYPRKVDLHGLWAETVEKHERIAELSKGVVDTHRFGVLLLRTLALRRGLEVRPRSLITLSAEGFAQDWRQAAVAMERAIELLRNLGPSGFGVFNERFLPSYAMLPVLAALRDVIETRKLGDGPRLDLQRWYWSCVFTERYSSTVETKSRRDYLDFTSYWLDGGPLPTALADARARLGAYGYSLGDPVSTASTVYVGVFNLLAKRGAQDWCLGEGIELQSLEDHHIFPQAYLKRHGITGYRDVNSIANRTQSPARRTA